MCFINIHASAGPLVTSELMKLGLAYRTEYFLVAHLRLLLEGRGDRLISYPRACDWLMLLVDWGSNEVERTFWDGQTGGIFAHDPISPIFLHKPYNWMFVPWSVGSIMSILNYTDSTPPRKLVVCVYDSLVDPASQQQVAASHQNSLSPRSFIFLQIAQDRPRNAAVSLD